MGTLLDLASLVTIPSGYKVGTVYSVVPTDGAGDLTFTRSNDTATRVGPNGLIEKVRTNVILQSNTFNTTWGSTDVTLTSGATDPNGGTTAWTAAATAANAITQQSVTLTGLRTFSIYAKQGTLRYLYMGAYGGTISYATFDLQNGVISAGTNARIESVGGGWYRCTCHSADGTSGGVQIFPTNTISSGTSTTGNILIWRCQYESGDIATDYIPTTTTAVSVGPVANLPRLDYLNSTCPNLLLEPQRTNLITYSEQINDSSWIKGNSPTITTNIATAPDGYVSADGIQSLDATNYKTINKAISVSANSTITYSIFVKKETSETAFGGFGIAFSGGTDKQVYGIVNAVTGTVTFASSNLAATVNVQNYGTYWRIATTTTDNGSNTIAAINYYGTLSTNGTSLDTGAGSVRVVWGFQFEVGAYVTSYVPTLGAASTRGTDDCVKSSATALIGQTEGTIYWEGIIDAFPTDNSFFGVQKTSTSAVIRFGSGGINVYAQVYNGSTNLFFEPTSYTLGTFVKLGFAYKAGSYAFYKNGTLVAVGTTATAIPSCDSIMFNSLWGNVGNGKYSSSEAIIFPTRLSNSELAQLTTL
jgi:hypothetical protein